MMKYFLGASLEYTKPFLLFHIHDDAPLPISPTFLLCPGVNMCDGVQPTLLWMV